VEIREARQGAAIAIEVEDDGKGIVPDRLLNKESFGVLGMHERAAYFGAELKITGAPGQGTLYALTLTWGTSKSRSADTGFSGRRPCRGAQWFAGNAEFGKGHYRCERSRNDGRGSAADTC
jgi:hypothetical protein